MTEAYPTAGLPWGRAFWRFFFKIDLNFCMTLLHSLVIWLWHAFFFWVCVYSAWGHPLDRSWEAWIICICWHSCLDIPSKLMVSQENSFNSIVWYCAIVYLKCLISFFKEMVWCLGYERSICVCSKEIFYNLPLKNTNFCFSFFFSFPWCNAVTEFRMLILKQSLYCSKPSYVFYVAALAMNNLVRTRKLTFFFFPIIRILIVTETLS